MDKNYTVVETSKLAAVRGGGHIYSLISDDDVQNGHIGYVGDLADEVQGQETYEFGVFDADTINKKRAVLVANPEWDYDESRRTNQALYNFINKADEPFRCFSLIEGDVFAVSAKGFNATGVDAIEKGQYVILEAGKTTLKIVETEEETDGYGFVGQIGDPVKRGLGFTSVNGQTYGRPSTMYFVHIKRNDIVYSSDSESASPMSVSNGSVSIVIGETSDAISIQNAVGTVTATSNNEKVTANVSGNSVTISVDDEATAGSATVTLTDSKSGTPQTVTINVTITNE